jgi:hypothetical protein
LEEIALGIDNWGEADHYDGKEALRTLLLAERLGAHPLDAAAELWSVSEEMSPLFCRKVLETARGLLRGVPQNCDHIAVEVAKTLKQFDDDQIDAIKKILRNASAYFVVASGDVLHPQRQNLQEQRRAFAYSYLQEQGTAVHIRELFSAMQDFEPQLVPDSPTLRSAMVSLDGLLARDNRFAWAGQSTWGLREWGYPDGVSDIGSAAIAYLRASSLPLTTTELVRPLSGLYKITRSGVGSALRNAEGISVRRDATGRWYAI